jgi:hypothetical protein
LPDQRLSRLRHSLEPDFFPSPSAAPRTGFAKASAHREDPFKDESLKSPRSRADEI